MKISVIIPTYKRPDSLKTALLSLVNQMRKPDETVIITRESDVETHDLLEEFKDRLVMKVVKVGEISKISALENIGASNSSGDAIAFFDDDAEALPEWLSSAEAWMQRDDIGACGGPIIETGTSVNSTCSCSLTVKPWGHVVDGMNFMPDKPRFVDHLPGSNMFFKKKYFNKFDERLLGYSYRFELDACLAIRNQNRQIMFDPKMRTLHHSIRVQEGRNIRTLKEIFETNANNTYVLLKHLSFSGRFLFLFYTFLWGDASTGMIRYFCQSVKHRSLHPLHKCIYALAGKIRGFIMWSFS